MYRLPFFWDSMMCHLMEIMRKQLYKGLASRKRRRHFKMSLKKGNNQLDGPKPVP